MKRIKEDNALARQVLINSFGSGGYKILCSLVAPKEPSQFNSMTKLKEHLSPRVNKVIEQHRFTNCVQTEKQSIAELLLL